jgi:hypothetical protein
MSSRFQIKDSAGNTTTLQLSENFTDQDGEWMPDDPNLRSGLDWSNNPYDAVDSDSSGHPYDAVLYTIGSSSVRVPVMKIRKVIGIILYESSGSGTLFATGVQGSFVAGAMTWTKL